MKTPIRTTLLVSAILLQLLTSARSLCADIVTDSAGFEGYALGNLEGQSAIVDGGTAPWQATVGATSTVVVQNAVSSTGTQAVRFDRAAGSADRVGVVVANPVGPGTTTVIAQWDMLVPTHTITPPLGATGPVFGFDMYDAGSNMPFTPNLAFLGVDQTSGQITYQDPDMGGAYNQLGDLGGATLDTWNTFRIELDFLTMQQSLFVNNIPLVTKEFTDSSNAVFNPGLVPLSQYTDGSFAGLPGAGDAASLALTGTAYFDNLTVTAVPEPSAFLAIGVVAVLALSWRFVRIRIPQWVGFRSAVTACLILAFLSTAVPTYAQLPSGSSSSESDEVRGASSYNPFELSRTPSKDIRSVGKLGRFRPLPAIRRPPARAYTASGIGNVFTVKRVFSLASFGFRPPPRSPFRPPPRGPFAP